VISYPAAVSVSDLLCLIAVMISHGNLICTFLQAAAQGQEVAKFIPVRPTSYLCSRDMTCTPVARTNTESTATNHTRIPPSPSHLRPACVCFSKCHANVNPDYSSPVERRRSYECRPKVNSNKLSASVCLCLFAVRFKITYLPLIPSVVVQTVNYLRKNTVDLSSVQIVTCGAAHLPLKLGRKLTRFIPKSAQLHQG
jgi:acyl-CoA synthetase (AMP-forming)/AMP-acid ligase II